MKTTLEIADPLLDEVRRIASRDGEGLRDELAGQPWERMRDTIYGERGS